MNPWQQIKLTLCFTFLPYCVGHAPRSQGYKPVFASAVKNLRRRWIAHGSISSNDPRAQATGTADAPEVHPLAQTANSAAPFKKPESAVDMTETACGEPGPASKAHEGQLASKAGQLRLWAGHGG